MSDEYVQITVKEYADLTYCQNKLYALEAAGVDGWDGFDYAMEILHAEDEEDD